MKPVQGLRFIAVLMAAFLGGLAGQFLLHGGMSLAGAPISTPATFYYGDDGQPRLQMGTYPGAGERGLPLLGFSDNHGRLRMLFRLAGSNESPVIIMKDTSGNDRMVLGLGLSGNEAPFMTVVDDNGRQRNILMPN